MSLQRGSNYVEMKEDAAVLEAKRRRYLSSPLSECSDPDLWMQLNHHDHDDPRWKQMYFNIEAPVQVLHLQWI